MLKVALPIARPPWKKGGKKLESACRKAIYDFKLLENVSHIAVALSGGKDSLTLLYLLHAISGKGFPPFKISAFHVDGAFSCGASLQVNFLSAICKELGVELHIATSQQALPTLECYSCSRERRRLLFNLAATHGIRHIAFGHHRDDHAQTLMMNMIQKGEFAGLLPKIEMHRFGVTIIRPLIYLPETTIRQFARDYNFAKITCQCPVGQNSMRKKVDRLLTEMELLTPEARLNIARAGWVYGSDKAGRVPENLAKKEDCEGQ